MSNRKDALDGANKIHIFLALHAHTHKFAFFTIETTLLHPICDVMYVTSRKKVSKVYFIGLSYFYSSLYTFISRLKDEFGIFLQLLNRYSRRHFFQKIATWLASGNKSTFLPPDCLLTKAASIVYSARTTNWRQLSQCIFSEPQRCGAVP